MGHQQNCTTGGNYICRAVLVKQPVVTCLLCLRKAVYHLISDNKTRWVKRPFVILTMDKLLQCLPCCVSFEKRQYLIPLRFVAQNSARLYADRGTHAFYTEHFEHGSPMSVFDFCNRILSWMPRGLMQQQPVHAHCGSALLERPHSSQPQMFNHWLLVGEF